MLQRGLVVTRGTGGKGGSTANVVIYQMGEVSCEARDDLSAMIAR